MKRSRMLLVLLPLVVTAAPEVVSASPNGPSCTAQVDPGSADANVTVGPNYIGFSFHLKQPTGTVACQVGKIGGVQNPGLPRSPGERTQGDRSTVGQCDFRVDTTEGNNVLLTVTGRGTTGGRPRAVATEIQCRIINDDGAVVFDLTRAEIGSVAALTGAVIIRNDGPYTVCARADAKFDDGEDVSWPVQGDFVTMACATP